MSHRVVAIPFMFEDGDFNLLLVTSLTRGRWLFPRGTLKIGEGKLKGCRRDAFEEAGIKVKIFSE